MHASGMNRSGNNWRRLVRSWATPFLIGLAVYFAIPSHMMLGDLTEVEAATGWHPAYFGWYDVALWVLAFASLYLSRERVSRTGFAAMSVVLGNVLLSFIKAPAPFEWGLVVAAGVYWLRFAAVFIVMINVVSHYGVDVAATIVVGIGLLLMITSVFVYSLQYETYNRVYAAGMTVGSFSQAMLLVAWVGLIRRRQVAVILATGFLLLTFSRTGIALGLVSLLIYVAAASDIRHRARWATLVVIAAVFALVAHYVSTSPEFAAVITDRLDPAAFESMSDRTPLWDYGNGLLASGQIPLTGVGFNNTTWLLTSIRSERQVPSFHSIVYEYAVGMGILSVPIFLWLLGRIVKTSRRRLLMANGIYLLFLLTQCVDFTFYHPKEVVFWALCLGLAEGELQVWLRQTQASRGGLLRQRLQRNVNVWHGRVPRPEPVSTVSRSMHWAHR